MFVSAKVHVTASNVIWGTLSGSRERADLTAPIVLMVRGLPRPAGDSCVR